MHSVLIKNVKRWEGWIKDKQTAAEIIFIYPFVQILSDKSGTIGYV